MADLTESQVLGYNQALEWAHILEWQIGRLRESRPAVLRAHELVMARGQHTTQDNHPYWRMDAEKHFALVAARQLLRALRAYDGNVRLPDGLPAAQVRDLRDALEHWDQPKGRAREALTALNADAASHQWVLSGEGLLGDLVTDEALRQWAADVYAELAGRDPWGPAAT